MEKVLLPLALDYHIRSRDIEVNEVAAEELNNLNGDANAKSGAVQVRQWKTWLQINIVPPLLFQFHYFFSLWYSQHFTFCHFVIIILFRA